MTRKLELVCPAGTPGALHTAISAGADVVYVGFRDQTNARNFPGLNFSRRELGQAVTLAHAKGAQVFVAINSFPEAGNPEPWRQAIDDAADLGADAVIIADIGVAAYARASRPDLRLHLSVQASASSPEAIEFYCREFGVRRVVLPRVLTVPEIAQINAAVAVETEVFAFGGLCVMAEGRCALSSYATSVSPNKDGACSPASDVRYSEEQDILVTRLNRFTINKFAPDEAAGYPTLCKGRFSAGGKTSYLFEYPTSLNVLDILPELIDAGVTAIKIEGRQRGRAYVREVVTTFRQAIDAVAAGQPVPPANLCALSEGSTETLGVYKRGWK